MTHPATRMITRRGSPATVIKKRAKAGPNATKVHPKNTAAPMAGAGGRGGGLAQGGKWEERVRWGSPRRVATRPHEGRGAMSPPDPGEGEGGTDTPEEDPRDFLYGSRGGDKAWQQPHGHLPSNPHPRKANGDPGWAGLSGAGGGAARPAGSCSPAALVVRCTRSRERLGQTPGAVAWVLLLG